MAGNANCFTGVQAALEIRLILKMGATSTKYFPWLHYCVFLPA